MPFSRSVRFISALLLCVSGGAVPLASAFAAGDFDGDGLSDYTLVTIGSSSLAWKAKRSTNGTSLALGSLGAAGDELALADWEGAGKPQIAVVHANSSTGNLEWKVKKTDSSTATRIFGRAGQTAVAGGDFNGDGRADALIVRKVGHRLGWTVLYDLLSQSTGAQRELRWGGRTTQAFFVNLTGARDRIAFIRRTSLKSALIRMRDLQTGKVRKRRVRGNFGSARPFARPVPVALADGTDMLMTSRKAGGVTTLTFLNLKNGKLSRTDVAGTGDVVVGNFLADPGEEVAVQISGGFNVFNPTTNALQTVSTASGIAVDEINANAVKKSGGGGGSNPTPNPTPTPGDGNSEPPPAGLASVCQAHSIIASGDMLIKSEISDHINPIDKRATGYTVICGRQCPKNLNKTDFFYSDGSYAGSVGYYGTFSGNGRPRLYGAAGGAPQHFVSQIAPRAASIGNGKLYLQISAATSGAGTDCKEFNPTGRNGSL